MEDKSLSQQIRAKEIAPGAAVDTFELGDTTWLRDIPVSALRADVLDCGFPALNRQLIFKKGKGEFIIVGARPSHGKSALAMQVAQHIALAGGRVLVFSTEMDAASIMARLMAERTKAGVFSIMTGQVSHGVLQRAHEQLAKVPIAINNRDSRDIASLSSTALAFHRRYPLSLVVVDYIQQVGGGDKSSRNNEIGAVSSGLKALAIQLGCPVLGCSQLSRKCEDRGFSSLQQGRTPNFVPELSDLRESGNIEQDADAVIFISRHERYVKGQRVGQADIVLAKARNGETGQWIWEWRGATTRFIDPSGKEQETI